MSVRMQNIATANEVFYTKESLSVEVAVGETKAWSACKFLEGLSGTQPIQLQ